MNQNLKVIYAAALFRSLGVGLTGVLLGVYLSRAGFSESQLGVVIAAGLGGAAAGTAVVSFAADRLGRRRTLVVLGLLGALGGAGLALTTSVFQVAVLAFVGMVNGMGTDRGPSFALEQAIIPQTTSNERRTWALSLHSLMLDAGHALGALAAALPTLFERSFQMNLIEAYRFTFGLYAAVNLLAAGLYLFLSSGAELAPGAAPARDAVEAKQPARISPQSKAVVTKLAALSGIDSLGGGFLSDALIAYWFFRRFGIPEASLGLLFFAGHVLNSASYLAAAWLARRIGLLKTMVFTHIPSSLFLMAVPLVSSPTSAIAFLLAREALVEMDVPTRQSYVMAVVRPEERTFASGVTNLTRNIARAVSPSFAGLLMQSFSLATPMFLGGGLKIAYDLLMYRAFRRLKPPEERTAESPAAATTAVRGES